MKFRINQGGKGIHSTQSSEFYGLLIHVLLHTNWKSQEKKELKQHSEADSWGYKFEQT